MRFCSAMVTKGRTILSPTMETISRPRNGSWQLIVLFLCLALALPLSAESTKAAPDKKQQDREVYQVVMDFMLDIRKGSVVKAYETLTSHDFRASTPLKTFITFVSQYATLRRNRSVQLIKIQYHENVAVIDTTLSSLEY